MSGLDDYIYMLSELGYRVMFTEPLGTNSFTVQLSKNGRHLRKIIPLEDMPYFMLDAEKFKINLLNDMKKELDAELKEDETPRWTDYQVDALTVISEKLTQLSDNVISECFRTKLRIISTEIKNIIPMEMIKMKGEEK